MEEPRAVRRNTAGRRPPRLRAFDSWIRHRDYRLLWFGNYCANSAQWLQLLTVGWLVRNLTAGSASSPLQVVTVGGLATLPLLIVGPWAGVLGDRVDRRKLVMATQVFMACVAALFAALVASEHVQVWHAYVYVLIGGSAASITMPMQQALIANTVPREDLTNAYAANVITITSTRITGPFVGGLLIFGLGFVFNFAIEAGLYTGVVLLLLTVKTRYGNLPAASGSSPLANMAQGIRYIWRDQRVILNLMFLGLVPNVLLHPLWLMLPTFTSDVLHRGADFGGYLLATTGFGGLVSTMLIASLGFGFRKGVVCLVSAIMSSICVILFAQSHWLVPSFILIALMAFSQANYRTSNGVLIQLLSPDALRGRVTTLQQMGQGLVPLSSLLIGLLAWRTTPAFAFTVVGLAGLGLAIYFLFTSYRLRRLE
jgi:MFS family permease